jgi:small-conductance mechanosensitive channel
MDELASWFSANQAIATIILVGAFVLLRKLVERILRGRDDFVSDERRRLISYTRNALVLTLAIGLTMIWAPALRTFALSVTAFLVAVVIATKELILCVTGGLWRTSSGSFSVGDWVRIGDLRGEVVDQSILSVTLQEVESAARGHHFTGRTITLPNSLFLTTPVTNENFYKRFIYHSIEITLEKEDDPEQTAALMEEAMNRAIADSREVSRRYQALIVKRAGVSMPPVDARTRLTTSPEGRVRIAVTAFVPTGEIESVERKVMSHVLGALFHHRQTLRKAGAVGDEGKAAAH